MNGAPSVQMQEIPPDLMGWMESEERNAEEKQDEEEGNGTEKGREDGHRKRNEFFDGEKDGEGDTDKIGGSVAMAGVVEEEVKPVAVAGGSSTSTSGSVKPSSGGGGKGKGKAKLWTD